MLGEVRQDAEPVDGVGEVTGGAARSAPVSYLPPPRQREDEHERQAVRGHGDAGSSSGAWQWHDTPASRDSSQAAFTGDLNRILAQADVLLEVLDARDPDGCRSVLDY